MFIIFTVIATLSGPDWNQKPTNSVNVYRRPPGPNNRSLMGLSLLQSTDQVDNNNYTVRADDV